MTRPQTLISELGVDCIFDRNNGKRIAPKNRCHDCQSGSDGGGSRIITMYSWGIS